MSRMFPRLELFLAGVSFALAALPPYNFSNVYMLGLCIILGVPAANTLKDRKDSK